MRPSPREEREAMTRLLAEPVRSHVAEAVERMERGCPVPACFADWLKKEHIPRKLAVLVALEAAEWAMAGALRVTAPGYWGAWFRIELFPRGLVAVARLEQAMGARRVYRLSVAVPSLEGHGLRESVGVLAELLAAHLGAPVHVFTVG